MKLSKYHGLGNDFVFGKYDEVSHLDLSTLAINSCDRHTGIGADGLIIVKERPLEMIYYNSDGSRAEMCGNGIRCFAQFVSDEGISQEKEYEVQTLAGVMKVSVTNTNPFLVTVNMGKANYNPSSYFANSSEEMIDHTLIIENQSVQINSLLLGVPHTVIAVKDIDEEFMCDMGPKIEKHPYFKEGTNVNFYKQLSSNHIIMQTFERGAGLTLACGTGACATFALLHKKGVVDNQITVTLPLGDLTISIMDEDIIMNGPSEKVCDILLEEFE